MTYYRRNRERLLARAHERYLQDPEKFKRRSEEWARKNPERRRAWALKRDRAWRKSFPEAFRAKQRFYMARLMGSPEGRLLIYSRNRVRAALKGVGIKSAKTESLLGCPVAELRLHLERHFRPGMTWENYGPVWHVDHIRPCVSFDLTDPEQQRACFHHTNLQPLFAKENLKKGAHIA